VKLNGRSLADTPARLRNFGVVFQSYSLFPNMTVARNVAYGLECAKWPVPAIRQRIEEMLSLVHLADQAEKYPHQLSGGQQQRVALARALAPKPAVLLLDEPLSALDAKVREDLRAEIKELQSSLGITTVMVTHDQHEAMEIADRIVVMNGGVIEQIGNAAALYDHPRNRFVAEFIGRMNVLRWPHGGGTGDANHDYVGIRPEHVELLSPGAPATDCLIGRIEKCVYLGSVTRVSLALEDQNLLIELPGRRPDLKPGGTVSVRIPEGAVHRIEGVAQ
jgi:iron(III) transport system ATP-binding protein